jgi:uncharacterized membrane protein YhaH (DUF805 family)
MSFIESIRTVLSKYAVFNGRARRSEFWWYYLAVTVVESVLYFVLVVPGLTAYTTALTQAAMAGETVAPAMPGSLTAGYLILSLVALALFLPTLGAMVRRLHDTDRSGFFVLLGLIPLVGVIILIVWWASAGTPGENQYGPDPKAVAQPSAA